MANNKEGLEAAVERLEPCPFCGGAPILHNHPTAKNLWRYLCRNCDAGPNSNLTPESARNRWNTRPAAHLPRPENRGDAPPYTASVSAATAADGQFSAAYLWPGPWRYQSGWVWGPSLKGGETHVADIRGWGYLTGSGHGALGLPQDLAGRVQDEWGQTIVEAVNERFARLAAGQSLTSKSEGGASPQDTRPTPSGDGLVELRRHLDDLGYDAVFRAIGDAVEWKEHRTLGISVEKLIFGLTGLERQALAALERRSGDNI